MNEHDEAIAGAFRLQSDQCQSLGSPLTARLLADAAMAVAAGSPATAVLRAWRGDPARDALPLRFAGALHYLVLCKEAPELAGLYPSAGGTCELEALWPSARALVADRGDFFEEFLRLPPQTNEVQRSAMLLGGFLSISQRSGLPLALREIGASAGLNLLWDRYRYLADSFSWSAPSWSDRDAGGLCLPLQWEGAAPELDAPVHIYDRRGCDLAPIDLGDAHQRLRLEAFVWPDQSDRLGRLRSAVQMARDYLAHNDPLVQAAGAAQWLEHELAARPAGTAVVVYHSVVWQYLPEGEQQAVAEIIETAGAASTPQTPLAWLSMEPDRDGDNSGGFPLCLRFWSGGTGGPETGGEKRILARCHPHGARIRWEA